MRALSKAGNTPFSLTMALDALAREKQSRGEDIINLTAGEVDLPASSLGAEAGERAFREGFTRYTASSGADFLKEAVRAAYYPAYAKEQILIGNGAKSCLNAAVACIAGPGERVLLPAPCYVSYPEMIRLAGAEAVLLKTRRSEGFKLRPAELRAAVTPNTAALLLNNPCNPTGAVYSFAELAEIGEICCERDIYLLSDEVYDAFTYDSLPFVSCTELSEQMRQRLVAVNAVSKSYSMAGLRIGFGAAPEPLIRAMGAYLSQTQGCPCSVSQKAAAAALLGDREYPIKLRLVFERRRNLLQEKLKELPCLKWNEPAGAFYFLLSVEECLGMRAKDVYLKDDAAFCRALLEQTGLALTPGVAFHAPGYVRLSFAREEKILLEACDRLRAFLSGLTKAPQP